jgi:hypothetical protein
VHSVFRAPKQVTALKKRNIAVRIFANLGQMASGMREFGAKNPTRSTGMQFAPL